MGGAVLTAFSYENEIETQNHLIEAIQQYAPPEHDDPDLELAKNLKSIDDELAKKRNRKQYFPNDKGLLKGNFPQWAARISSTHINPNTSKSFGFF